MSCNNWEQGSIKIPADQWREFRARIIGAFNRHRHQAFDDATRLHAWVKKNSKGKTTHSAIHEGMNALNLHSCGDDAFYGDFEVEPLLWRIDREGDRIVGNTLIKPQKKAMGLLPLTKDAKIVFGEACIVLRNKEKTVGWSTGENNRAVEAARSHAVAQILFRELNRIQWKRNSGGVFVGNDEYNEDTTDEGGGANYVTARYGPLGNSRN